MVKDFWYVPSNLDLKAVLEKRGYTEYIKPHRLDLLCYVIDHIYLTGIFRDAETLCDGFVPLNAKVLEEILTTRFAVKVKQVLVAVGVVEVRPSRTGKSGSYVVGKESKCYRFCTPYREATFRRIPIHTTRFAMRLAKNAYERSEAAVNGSSGRKLIRQSVERVEFDVQSALQFVESQPYLKASKAEFRSKFIDAFRNRVLVCQIDSAGRFYHLLTRCPRDLRKFITWKGKKLFSVDVSNCQPALHALLYPDDCPEKCLYGNLVASGEFYSHLNKQLKKPFDLHQPEKKAELKKKVFTQIYYGNPDPRKVGKLAKVFRDQFPVLDKLIKAEKVGNNLRDLPVKMQSIEAEIVIDDVATGFAERQTGDDVCLISIHDCLVTTAEHVDEVENMMADAFRQKLGFALKTKVSAFGEE